MNYYEEFGVPSDATTDEIRSAYRSLARIVHPDQQQDEHLRQAAERQMRRLNEIFSVLTDERARLAYDHSVGLCPWVPKRPWIPKRALRRASTLRPPRETAHWVIRESYLWLAGFVVTGLVIWYFSTSPEPVPATYSSTRAHHRSGAKADNKLFDDKAAPAPGDTVIPQRPDPIDHKGENQISKISTRARSAPPPSSDAPRKPPDTPVETDPQPASPPPLAAAAPTVTDPPSPTNLPEHPPGTPDLIGAWLYAPSTKASMPKLQFAPSYIEMIITDEEPQLKGRYRGRYRSPDSPLVTEVSFAFQGSSGNALQSTSASAFHWIGPEGVKGEGTLKLLTADSLEVNWWTTVAPREPALVSGAAVLVKLRGR